MKSPNFCQMAARVAFGAVTVLCSLPASAFVYEFSRTVVEATAEGFIETDGTVGTFSGVNVVDWEITLRDPLNPDGVVLTPM
ncbi:MAG: hypothetical protein AAGD86_05345, partial [Pseudomonadota bacterium]